jgi:hypothetical protein
VFSVSSVPRLYNQIPIITEGVTELVQGQLRVSRKSGEVSPEEFLVPRFQSD